MRRATLLTLLLAALTMPLTASAAQPRASFTDIEDEVMCVSCNVALNIAESPQADRQRALIRSLVARGLTKEQVKQELVATYGSNVLALPDDDGFGLVAYVIPIAVAVGLAATALLLLPRWRRRAPAPVGAGTAQPTTLDDADARRLDADLERYDD